MISDLKRLNCVSCGGQLEVVGEKLVCSYCKNVFVEVEKISEEEVIALNRATTDRNLFRFDDAYEEYNLLTAKYPRNEMAHWGALLCDYGIVYEKDYDGKLIPTCHRLSERPVTKSPNYPYLNGDHRAMAEGIEKLRLSISQKAKAIAPYDVFICYKATDDYHGRSIPTKESGWARDLYELLTHELKLKVFFAEKSLQGSNAEYEPHIYSALNSAKIMFVLANSLDHVNAVWVKNEWKRYSKYIQEGQNKTIRVIYDDIEPYNLPRELQKNQAISHDSMYWGNLAKSAVESIFKKSESPKPTQSEIDWDNLAKSAVESIFKKPEATIPIPHTKTPYTPSTPTQPKMDAETANKLGLSYKNGTDGKTKNLAEAARYFTIAAEQGHKDAQFNLGDCYYFGEGVTQNYTDALKWFTPAAEQGHSIAQFNLGYFNDKGLGIPKNLTEAVKWYTLSAKQGYLYAQFNLGVCYDHGLGVAQNYAEAVKWYRLAADQGHADAQFNLGVCYENGQGVTQNYAEAVKWYRLAADQGHADAQCNLGVCYKNGQGVAQNYAEAVKWYRLAADQGHAKAQYNLGICCKNGQGVAQNYAEAVKWYRLAADQGHAKAQYNLGFCYDKGRGVVQNRAEAVKWYRLAADQGHADAQCNLGFCYYKGQGVAQNRAEAVKWFRLAAKQGHEIAKDNLKILGYNI